MRKDVMIFIKDVKYYKEECSLIIVGEEVETKKPITQQITVKDFLKSTGMFSDDEINTITTDDDRCRLFARHLKDRREPFKLVFTDNKTDKDEI